MVLNIAKKKPCKNVLSKSKVEITLANCLVEGYYHLKFEYFHTVTNKHSELPQALNYLSSGNNRLPLP